jgi:D-cysteine desulfhydrase
MKAIPKVGTQAPVFAVTDGKGASLSLADLQGRKTVLIFLRHLGCPICRMEIAELKRRIGEFKDAGAEVVVFVDSPAESVTEFAQRDDVTFRIVADPQRSVYAHYGIERGGLLDFIAPGAALRSVKATLKGHMHGRFEGSELLLPGDFVLDASGKILYAHRGAHIGDNTPLDTLLAIVKSGAETPHDASAGVSRRAFLVAGGAGVAAIAGGVGYYNHAVDAIGTFDETQVEALYNGAPNLLLDRYPKLRGKLPWLPLGTYPTPVELLSGEGQALLPRDRMPGAGALYVKRDDLTSPHYGGNKVRKLEHVLAEAKLLGRKALLTVGGLGSNQCLATSIHGGRLGFEVDIALFQQPVTPHVIENLLADHHHGANFVYGGSYVGTAAGAVKRYLSRKEAYYIPAGATTPLGNIGYVTAALELADQVKAGAVPEPDRIFVAAGSCGTAAGLVAGCKLAGLRSRVVAVRITDAIVANAYNIARNANALLEALRAMDPTFPEVRVSTDDFDVETAFFGRGYGVPTEEAEAAVAAASPVLKLETTYTAKALAAALDALAKSNPGETLLYWHTLNSAEIPRSPSIESLPKELQAALQG